MKVSVIIPTYNRASYLPRAVYSVLNQSYRDLELIIVDDGSTDNTRDFLKTLDDPRVKIIYQENRGVSAARNRGIYESSGELIGLLDSDDQWLEDKLKIHLKFHLEGGFEISQTEEIWIRRGKRVNPGIKHRKRAGWIFEPSLELCLISPSCVLFSKRLFQEIGPFDESLPACEDYDMWLRATLRYPVGLCPFPLVIRYGGRADQLSSKIIGLDLYRIYSLIKILSSKSLDSHKIMKVKKVLKKKTDTYIKGCLKRGKLEEAERIIEYVKNYR